MNEQLEAFARDTLKQGLAECTYKQKLIFKRMYSPGNLDADVNDVVDQIPANKLDWAMQQVEQTIRKQQAEGQADA